MATQTPTEPYAGTNDDFYHAAQCAAASLKTEPLRLNLGCGEFPLPGYLNLDRKQGQEAYPLELPDESVDEVRASHLLEHFSHQQVIAVLDDWVRVLKPGGLLKIAVPDLNKILHLYQTDPEANVQGYLMGGHTDEDDYHKCVFDEGVLRNALEQVGLVDIEPWESEIGDCASLPVSLNLQGRKPLSTQKPAAPVAPRPTRTPCVPSGSPYAWLQEHAWNRYSQCGEDGLLEAIFSRIGPTNRWIVECGAGHPTLCSNSRALLEQGWNALLIEKDPALVEKHREAPCYGGRRVLTDRPVEVEGKWSLDGHLRAAGLPTEFDILVLDIDGQEYHVWNSLIHHRPRIVVVEYDRNVDPDFIPEIGGEGQAGWRAIMDLGSAKGYEAILRGPYNVFFVMRGLHTALMEPVPKEPAPQEVGAVAPSGSDPDEEERGPTTLGVARDLAGMPAVDMDEVAQNTSAILTLPRLCFSHNVASIITGLAPFGMDIHFTTGVFWGQCLTRMIEERLAEGKRYLLTLDYDTLFKPRDVATLYYLMEHHPEVDAICPVQMRRGLKGPLFTAGTVKDGHMEIDTELLKKDLMPIRTGHFGLTILRASAFEKLPKPWFMPTPDSEGGWGEGRVDEDIAFWKNWEASGHRLCLANRVVVGHLESLNLVPDRRFNPIYQNVNDYFAQGLPEGVWR